MRITPLDVRKQEFKKVVRGLDPEEVYAFLATVADEYETVLTDNRQLRDRVLELDEKVVEYRNMEKTLRDTLMTAERVMAEARENARKEAELILRDAKVQAQQNSQDTAVQAEALRTQLRDLRSQRDAFLARLKGLAEAQIGMVDSFVRDFREDDKFTDFASSRTMHESSSSREEPSSASTSQEPSAALNPFESPAEIPGTVTPQDGYPEQPQSSPVPDTTYDSPATEAPTARQMDSGQLPVQYTDSYEVQPASDPDGPTRGYAPAGREDHWRNYHPGPGEVQGSFPPASVETPQVLVAESPMDTEAAPNFSPTQPSVGQLADTVAEMAHAAGDQSGQLPESVPSFPDSGAESMHVPATEQPEEEPAAVASAEESEESQEGSRWSISRFTRGLGDF